MKRMILTTLCAISLAFLSGCCMDDICDAQINFNANKTCQSCNVGCNTCGYEAGYNSSWF